MNINVRAFVRGLIFAYNHGKKEVQTIPEVIKEPLSSSDWSDTKTKIELASDLAKKDMVHLAIQAEQKLLLAELQAKKKLAQAVEEARYKLEQAVDRAASEDVKIPITKSI